MHDVDAEQYSYWFVVTGASTLADARDRVLELLEKSQIAIRSQRAYAGAAATETIDSNVRALALCARWNRDFPHRRIPPQEPLW